MRIVYLRAALVDAVATMEAARDAASADGARQTRMKMTELADRSERRADVLTSHAGVLRRILEALDEDDVVELKSGGEA